MGRWCGGSVPLRLGRGNCDEKGMVPLLKTLLEYSGHLVEEDGFFQP